MEKQKSKGIISPDRAVKDARRVFEYVIKNNNLNKFSMAEQSGKITLGMMNEAKALLPSWIMRAEDISVVLFGKRLWNVRYQGDFSSLLGYSVHDETDNKPEIVEDLPFSIIYLICQQAMADRVEINKGDKTYTPKTEYGYFYDMEGVKEHGDILEFNSSRNIVAFEINKIMSSLSKEHKLIRELKHDSSEKLDVTIDS